MSMDQPHSVISGVDPQARALVFAAVADNTAPTVSTDQMFPVGMNARIDIVTSETAGGTYQWTLWWWYSDAGIWVPDLTLTNVACAANSTSAGITSPSAASGAYVQVHTFAAGGEANVWGIARGTVGRWQ